MILYFFYAKLISCIFKFLGSSRISLILGFKGKGFSYLVRLIWELTQTWIWDLSNPLYTCGFSLSPIKVLELINRLTWSQVEIKSACTSWVFISRGNLYKSSCISLIFPFFYNLLICFVSLWHFLNHSSSSIINLF